MAHLVKTRCPECGARLSIDPDSSQVRCDYCGTVCRVEHRRHKSPPPPPGEPAQPVIHVGTSTRQILVAILGPVVLSLVIVGISVFQMIRATGGDGSGQSAAGAIAGLSGEEKIQWVSHRQPLLTDITGNGIADPVGWVRFVDTGGSRDHLAAFDAVTGKRLWATAQIPGEMSNARVALAADTLIIADSTGMLHAHSRMNGQRLWTAMLGERVDQICGAGSDHVRIEKTDHQQLKVALATGLMEPMGKVDKAGRCDALWTDIPGRTPGAFIGGTTFDNLVVQPLIENMDVELVVVDPESDTYVAIGAITPGTAVPVAARYMPPPPSEGARKHTVPAWMNKPKVTPLWLSAIPTVNPMTVKPASSKTGTIADGRLIAPYEVPGDHTISRLAALDVDTGRNIWDVIIPLSDTSRVSTVVASDQHVFVGIWLYLHIFDLATGEHRMTIGRW